VLATVLTATPEHRAACLHACHFSSGALARTPSFVQRLCWQVQVAALTTLPCCRRDLLVGIMCMMQ